MFDFKHHSQVLSPSCYYFIAGWFMGHCLYGMQRNVDTDSSDPDKQDARSYELDIALNGFRLIETITGKKNHTIKLWKSSHKPRFRNLTILFLLTIIPYVVVWLVTNAIYLILNAIGVMGGFVFIDSYEENERDLWVGFFLYWILGIGFFLTGLVTTLYWVTQWIF